MGNIAHLTERRRKARQITKPQQALTALGLPKKLVYRKCWYTLEERVTYYKARSFWERPAAELWQLLEVARNAYTALCRRHHPDRGGQPWRFRRIAEAWAFLKRHALRHGYAVG